MFKLERHRQWELWLLFKAAHLHAAPGCLAEAGLTTVQPHNANLHCLSHALESLQQASLGQQIDEHAQPCITHLPLPGWYPDVTAKKMHLLAAER